MSETLDRLILSWTDYESLERLLLNRIETGYKDIDVILAIARGGVYPAFSMANKLNLESDSFRIRSYTGIGEHATPKVMQPPCTDLRDKVIMLIDDISDSGNTFVFALDYLRRNYGPRKIYTAALFLKHDSKFVPDVYLRTTDKWVVFPWGERP